MQHWKQTIIDELEAATRWFLPSICPLCATHRNHRRPLCDACLEQLPRLPEARCPRCGLPYPSNDGAPHLCGDCTIQPPPFDAVCALGPYTGTLQKAIAKFKYNRLPLLDRPFGQLLGEAVRQSWPEYDCDFVLPVPLHARRLRYRTFNQSLLLAWQLGKSLAVPVAPQLLRRVRHTPPQQGLKASERLKNLQQALKISGPLPGSSLLLVDDVMTTGATVRACSKILRQAGAREIRVAVLARAPRYLHL